MIAIQADSELRYRLFVERVRASGLVWGLESEDGWCQSPSSGEQFESVIPFWSDRALAEQCARDGWSDYEPSSIPLAEFLEAWLPGMTGDGVGAGVNWNAQLIGAEIKPDQLAQDLAG